jgi:hypothetical protein
MFKSESYRPCNCGDIDCAYAADSTADRPCWGDVYVESEDSEGGGVHTCRGHAMIWSNDFYRDYVPEGESAIHPGRRLE